MKHRVLLALTSALTLLATSCWQAPTPPAAREVKVLATVQAVLDASGGASAQLTPITERSTRSALPDTAITFSRKFSSLFDDETSKQRYLSATFEVTNSSGQDFKNLTFYAYDQTANSLGGTAIKKMVNFNLEPINSPAVAQGIKPTHGMKHVGADVILNPDETDFQAFKTDEASAVQTAARTLNTISSNDTILEYGFVVRSVLGGRAIANNGKGYVTIAVKIPKQTDKSVDPYKFVMTFVLADDAVTRVTRSAEESTGEVETRAADMNAPEVVLIGTDENTVANRTNIRTSNVKIGSAPSYLLEAKLFMAGSNLKTFPNDKNTSITITGQEFTPDTSFFIQSTKLEASNITPTTATLSVPAGFLPSVYGLMAADPNGSRATLYPVFTITQGEPGKEIDPQALYQSFVDGYVTDEKTKLPIENARVSLNSTTQSLEVVTDSSGYYLIRGVPQGRNAFRIEAQGYEPVYRIAQVNGTAQTVTNKLAELEPKSQYVSYIGPNGGIHYASAAGKDGPFLVIPPGALERDVPIQFTHLETANTLPELPQDGYYLAFAHLAPTGLVFKKPATLFLPLQAGEVLPVGQKILISYFDAREAKWVQDITSGVISSVNGKLFLEYEINHFTWIGGQYLLDKVKGCVVDQDGKRLPGITTNWGVTDDNGDFEGTTTQSNSSDKILKGYAILPDGTLSNDVTVPYSGSSDVVFPTCIVYQTATPSLEGADFEELQDGGSAPYSAPSSNTRATTRAGGSNGACEDNARVPTDTNGVPVFVSSQLSCVGFRFKMFKRGNVDPSTIKYYFRGNEITTFNLVQDPLDKETEHITFVPPATALKAGLNIEFRVEGYTKGKPETRKKLELAVKIHIIAGFQTASLTFASSWDQNNDGNFPYWDLSEPVATVANGRMAAFYSPETGVENFTTRFPVLAVDEAAKTMGINFSSVTFQPDAATQGVTNIGNAPMQNGIAFIPVTFNSNDPKTIKLALARKGLKIDSSASIGSVKPDPRVKPRFIVVVIAYEVVQVGVAAAALASAVILEQLSKQRGAVLPEVNFQAVTDWFAEAGNKLQSTFTTVTNYVTVAIHGPIFLPAAPIQAPFRDTKPLTLPDLQKARLAPCQSNWTPPTGEALSNLMRQISNTRTPTLLDIASQVLLNSLLGSIFKHQGVDKEINKIVALRNQTELAKSLGQRFISTTKDIKLTPEYQAWQQEIDIWKHNGSIPEEKPQYPQNVGATEHARDMRTLLEGLKAKLQDRGINGPNNIPKECYSDKDMDYLYALYKLINEALENFDKWGGF